MSEAYMEERIVNISDLERHISLAYTTQQIMEKELSADEPNMKLLKEAAHVMETELRCAKDFEFCIERRKVTQVDCPSVHQ